jgi:peptide/nickel transport system substrate-binding protein
MAELVNVLAPLLAIEPQPVDDPDAVFYENYVCGAQRNYTVYCNPEVDKMVDSQSMESSVEKRKRMVWNIEKKLAEDDARPTLVWRPAGNRG